MNDVDRHDLEALKTWIDAEFRVVETGIQAIKDSIIIAAREQEKRDEQLNDVRLRFVPRAEYAGWVKQQEERADQHRRFLAWLTLAVFAQALAIVVLLVG